MIDNTCVTVCDNCAPPKPENWRFPDWWIALDEGLPCKCNCGERADWMVFAQVLPADRAERAEA